MDVEGLEKIKTVVYARVSTDKQELDGQINTLISFCNKKKYDISNIYAEIVSGTKERRPEFDQLFKDAHKLRFQHLVFYDLSRFSRTSIAFTLQKLKELDNLKITWESYQQPYLSTMGMFRDVLIAFFSEINKVQAEITSQKTKEALARKKAQGIKLGRPNGAKDKNKRKKSGYYKRYENLQLKESDVTFSPDYNKNKPFYTKQQLIKDLDINSAYKWQNYAKQNLICVGFYNNNKCFRVYQELS